MSTPWCSSSCSKVGYLAKGMLSFVIMKHSSNIRPICARVSRSIVDKLWSIAEGSTADPPLALTLSTRIHAMACLWASLVAWFSTLLTFWFTKPVIQTFEKFFSDSRLLSYFLHTAQWRDAMWRLSRSSLQ